MEFRTVTRTSRDSKEFRVQNLARGRAFARVCVAMQGGRACLEFRTSRDSKEFGVQNCHKNLEGFKGV